MLSKKEVWENYNLLMLNKELDEIELAKEEDLVNLGNTIAAHNIVGFDYSGLLWKYDDRQPDMARFNMASVNTVAGILSTIDLMFDQSPANYTKWRSSYGLKHDIEFIRHHRGDENPYVSNGEFMAGYLHYLVNVCGMEPRSVRCRIKPELDGGPNLFMKVSPAYQAIVDIARDRGFK